MIKIVKFAGAMLGGVGIGYATNKANEANHKLGLHADDFHPITNKQQEQKQQALDPDAQKALQWNNISDFHYNQTPDYYHKVMSEQFPASL